MATSATPHAGTLRILNHQGDEVVVGEAMRQRALDLFRQGYAFWTYHQEPGQDAVLEAAVAPEALDVDRDYLALPRYHGG